MANPIVDPSSRSDEQEQVPIFEDALRGSPQAASEKTIPVVEEIAKVEKQEVVTGRVRVRTITDTIEELAHAEVQREDVEVTRVPIDKVVEATPKIRTEGDVTIIPVMEEVLVIEKRLMLKEELHIRRRIVTEAVEVPVTLRKQHATVEREPSEDVSSNEKAAGGEPDNSVVR
ncbi:YsnF/AvaK domain-containing protein [Microvirga sp. P5_D2]